MKKLFIFLAFNFHCFSIEKYGDINDHSHLLGHFERIGEIVNETKGFYLRYNLFKNCISNGSKDFTDITPETNCIYEEKLISSIGKYINNEKYEEELKLIEEYLHHKDIAFRDALRILNGEKEKADYNSYKNFEFITYFAEELNILEKQLKFVTNFEKRNLKNFPARNKQYNSKLLEQEFVIIEDYKRHLINLKGDNYLNELKNKINDMPKHIHQIKEAFKKHLNDILNIEYNPEYKNNKKVSDEILRLLKIKNEPINPSLKIEEINQRFGGREIPLKNMQEYVHALKGNVAQAKQEMDQMNLYLYAQHFHTTNEDKFLIIQNVLQEKVKNPEIKTYEIFEESIIEYYRKEYNAINKIYDPILSTENIEMNFIQSVYGPSHLLLQNVQNSRSETNETYQNQLHQFFQNLERLKLRLNEKMTKSLKKLDTEKDAKLRGFYCDIFESNLTNDEIQLVFQGFNDAEGCPDIARLKYQEFRGLNKKINNDLEPGSLEELKQKIYKHLQEKRYEFFDNIITLLFQEEGEGFAYGKAKILKTLSKTLGLKNIEIDTVYDFSYASRNFLQNNKNCFLEMFKGAYNEKFILEECFNIAKEMDKKEDLRGAYETQILRYLQIKHYFSKEKKKVSLIDPVMGTIEETEYTKEDPKHNIPVMKPKALQEVMEDLFGFHEIIDY